MLNEESQLEIVEQRIDGDLGVPADTIIDDRFRIIRLVGTGGMCAVYEAEHIQLERRVAIKLLHLSSIANPDGVARFQREAILASELLHPNIIEMHGFGVWDKRPYIAMEYLEGRTLHQIVEEDGPISEERAAKILMQICGALTEAHGHNIVHRDLKASNVILLEPNDTVKLVDFGIARLLPESSEEVQKLTQTGQVLGSFLYMSPEQCMGRQVDARTDLYAFGCLMYKMLTGHTPFEAETPFELMSHHLTLPPPPMEGVSERMGEIAAWCLRKEPDRRPQNAAQLKSIFLGGDLEVTRAVEAASPSASSSGNPRKKKLLVMTVSTVVLSLVIGFFVFVFPHMGKHQPDAPKISIVEKTLLDSVATAKVPHDAGLANTALCKYYLEEKRWRDADVAGKAAVEAFEKANDPLSEDSLWATYYASVAGQNNGRITGPCGAFIRLSEDIPSAPAQLKYLGALHAAQCHLALRRAHHGDYYYRRALTHARPLDSASMQQARLEYAQFLHWILEHGYYSEQNPERHRRMVNLLNDIISAGGTTPEDKARIEAAKRILESMPQPPPAREDQEHEWH